MPPYHVRLLPNLPVRGKNHGRQRAGRYPPWHFFCDPVEGSCSTAVVHTWRSQVARLDQPSSEFDMEATSNQIMQSSQAFDWDF